MPRHSSTLIPNTELNKPLAVLFDWDGTLVDSLRVICTAMEDTLKHFNVEKPSDFMVKIHLSTFMKEHFPGLSQDQVKNVFRERYTQLANNVVHPLPHAEQTLKEIQRNNIKLAVVSNKFEQYLHEEIKRLGWEHYFLSIVGAGTVAEDKPSPLPVLKALSDIGMEPSGSIWFVGDSSTDMSAAHNSKCLPVFFGMDDYTSVYYDHCPPKTHFINHKALSQYFATLNG
jgi:phosphoglycolate phosphatase